MSKNFKAVLSSIVAVLLVSVFVFAAFANGGSLSAEDETATDITPEPIEVESSTEDNPIEPEIPDEPEEESSTEPVEPVEPVEPESESETEIVEPESESDTDAPKKVVLLGDVDGNGVVNAADARLTLRISAQLEKAIEDWQLYAADVDFNRFVTAQDARDILRYSAQLISEADWAGRQAQFEDEDMTGILPDFTTPVPGAEVASAA